MDTVTTQERSPDTFDLSKTITAAKLRGFTGTTRFIRHSLLPFVRFTDGCEYLMQHGAAWLIDAITSYQISEPCKSASYQIWTLSTDTRAECAVLRARAHNEAGQLIEIVRQDISYTDFPLREIELICGRNEAGGKTISLSSED